MWFHRSHPLDDWMLYTQDSPSTQGSRGFTRGSLFARDGTLIASVALLLAGAIAVPAGASAAGQGAALPVVLLPAQGQYEAGATPLDAASAERDLAALSDVDSRIWFFPQPAPNWDKDGAVGRWLGRFNDRDWTATFGTLNVERYLTPRGYQALWTPLSVQFDDHINLSAYRIPKIQVVGSKIELVLYCAQIADELVRKTFGIVHQITGMHLELT
jgi:hypothetical protein